MDPLSVATSFATVVGLLSNFKSERSGTQLSEFIDWLKEKHHEDVALDIERNQALSIQLKSVLSLNHQELVSRLDSLDKILSSIAARIQTFSDLAISVRQDSMLSDQAISIVHQFAKSTAREFWERETLDSQGPTYHLIGAPGQIDVTDPRFIEDDLNTLVELGILRLDYGSKGTRKFIITRQAVALANSVNL